MSDKKHHSDDSETVEQENPESTEMETDPSAAAVMEPSTSPADESHEGFTPVVSQAEEIAALHERVADLEREVEREANKASEYMQNWMRAQADFSNYKRRAQQDQDNLTKYASAKLIAELLPIMDNFERAIMTLPQEFLSLTWLSGIELIGHQLNTFMIQTGLTPIETEGKTFDPSLHEAISFEQSEGVAENTILAVLQKGYKLHDRVIRPALVKVAQGAKVTATPSEQPVEETAEIFENNAEENHTDEQASVEAE